MVNIYSVALTRQSIKERVRELNGEVTYDEVHRNVQHCQRVAEIEVYFDPEDSTDEFYTESGIPIDELEGLVEKTGWEVDINYDYENGGVHFLRDI